MNDAEEGTGECNTRMKMTLINRYPRLCLFALRAIEEGEEIRYDYGDDPEKLPWVMLIYTHTLENLKKSLFAHGNEPILFKLCIYVEDVHLILWEDFNIF